MYSVEVNKLCTKHKIACEHIVQAQKNADGLIDELREALGSLIKEKDETSFVVFGSLARKEMTGSSDLDWVLLVDGRVDPSHHDKVQKIRSTLKDFKPSLLNPSGKSDKCLKMPNPTGPFGNLMFSHGLIHRIGGDADTNENMTQRILLLLESLPIGEHGAYDRVIKSILERYVEEDPRFKPPAETQFRIPRFLYNDIVRFWRTMAVDFAYKRRTRSDGWALRNAKLRMSRKMIFVAGTLMCFSCHLARLPKVQRSLFDSEEELEPVINHLRKYVGFTPLQIVAQALQKHNADKDVVEKILGSYNEFLGLLGSEKKRKNLEALRSEDAAGDELFSEVRRISHAFQQGLIQFFFMGPEPVRKLTQEYGVF